MNKTTFITALLISFSFCLFAQEKVAPVEEKEVFTIVDDMPAFPGGQEALFQFLKSNLKYPDEAKKENIQGTVYVTFVIDPEGKVTKGKVLRGVHELLDEEALRVVNLMPLWSPGSRRGVPVSVQYNLPVKFTETQKGSFYLIY